MTEIDLGTDDGFCTIKFGETSAAIDVIDVWERFVQHQQEHQPKDNFLVMALEEFHAISSSAVVLAAAGQRPYDSP